MFFLRKEKTNKSFGDWGEEQATIFLRKLGYKIIEKNFSIRSGEIDIIAWKFGSEGRVLCFVEVKTRKGEMGSAERATDTKKIDRIQKAARAYCRSEGIDIDRTLISFEQVSVYDVGDRKPTIYHYDNISYT